MAEYKVKKGDTLSKIAKDRYGSLSAFYDISRVNNLSNTDRIEVGQTLKLPDNISQLYTLNDIDSNSKIISNKSKYYDYIVKDNRVYSRIKGTDEWKDITDNTNYSKQFISTISKSNNTKKSLEETKPLNVDTTTYDPKNFIKNDTTATIKPDTKTVKDDKPVLNLKNESESSSPVEEKKDSITQIVPKKDIKGVPAPAYLLRENLEDKTTPLYSVWEHLEPINPEYPVNYNIKEDKKIERKTLATTKPKNKQKIKSNSIQKLEDNNSIFDDVASAYNSFKKSVSDTYDKTASMGRIYLGGLYRFVTKDLFPNDKGEVTTKTNLVNMANKKSLKVTKGTNNLSTDSINNKLKYPSSFIDTIPMTKDNVYKYENKYIKAFKPTKNHYFASENVNLDEVKLGHRTRGDRTQIKTQGLLITTYHNGNQSFVNLGKSSAGLSKPTRKGNWNTGYIGYDKNGNFVHGNWTDSKEKRNANIKRGSIVASCPYIRIYDFPNTNGKFKLTKNKGISRSRHVAVIDGDYGDGIRRETPFNILLGVNNEQNKYGEITGGRVVFVCGNEKRAVSGSMDQIYSVFQDMKKRHKAEYVEAYIEDNGTFNKAIRTFNGVLDSETQRMYDEQNSPVGGNGLYIK